MNRDLSTKPLIARPTFVRYGVLAFACSLAMITYLDRAAIGKATDPIIAVLGLHSIDDLVYVLAAFNLAYAVFEVPTGWLGDVFGPRKTLIRIVLWWSVFTALTGMAGFQIGGIVVVGYWVLVAIRFLFGVGEAGAFPNITRALHNWLPITERGFGQGAVWMCGRLMGGLTPLIWTLLVVRCGVPWYGAFWLFGGLGAAWCVAFALWFRNRPEQKPGVNEAERQLIQAGAGAETEQAHASVPWGRLLRSRTLWMLCLMYFCMSYGWYFNLNYLPNYLQEQHGVNPGDLLGALFQGGPLIFGAAGCIIGGFLTDRYIRRTGDRRWGRRIFGIFGHTVCVPCYLFCIVAPSAWTFALAIALTGFFNDLAMGSAWAACQDVGKKHAAIVAGCMNTIGNLGGFVATLLTGLILGWFKNAYLAANGIDLKALDKASQLAVLKTALLPGYNLNFIIYAVIYGIAVLLWFGIDATRPVLREDAEPAPEPSWPPEPSTGIVAEAPPRPETGIQPGETGVQPDQ
jgi:MFS transporter, ACS family, glucarate transporter